MLATEAERFRSREDGDGGSSGAPEPISRRKRGCNVWRRDERERTKATGEGDRAPSPTGASVGQGDCGVLLALFAAQVAGRQSACVKVAFGAVSSQRVKSSSEMGRQ